MQDFTSSGQQLFDAFGLDSSLTTIDANVAACGITDVTCLETIASSSNYWYVISHNILFKSRMKPIYKNLNEPH